MELVRRVVEEGPLNAAVAGLGFGAGLGAALLAVFKTGDKSKTMGNRSSQGCVVEVAPADLDSKWRPLRPVAEVMANRELESCAMEEPWRITINPAAEMGEETRPSIRRSQSSSLSSSPPSSTSDWSEEAGVRRRRSYRIKRITLTQPEDEEDGARHVHVRPAETRERESGGESGSGSVETSPPPSALRIPRLQLLQAAGFSHADFISRLHRTADGLYGTQKIMSSDEAKTLVLLLESRDPDYLLKALTIVCNLAAFTLNQELLRECGVLDAIQNLVGDKRVNESQRIMLIQALSNLAVNSSNQPLLQRCIPELCDKVRSTTTGELERLVAIQALTNLTLQLSNPVWLPALSAVVPAAYGLANRESSGPVLGGLKLLVNLSCCPELAPSLLAATALPDFWPRLLLRRDEEVVIRALTLLSRLTEVVLALGLGEEELPLSPHPTRSVFRSLRDASLLPILRRLALLQGETAERATHALNILPNLLSPPPEAS